jgi:hypothetical protein
MDRAVSLVNLISKKQGMRYEFARMGDDDVVVHRVWLSDEEREFAGRYNNLGAKDFWVALVRDGFVPVKV